MVPPKSHSTTSSAAMTRSEGSWWGLAALAPAATIAKFTRWWPSARIWRPSSADTSASVRPTSSMSPPWSRAAMRSTAAPAARSISISSGPLTDRMGAVTSEARRHSTPGSRRLRSIRNRAQVWSPTAATSAEPIKSATISTGSAVSGQPLSPKMSGRSVTLGASIRGTTRVAEASAGTTSMVRRSSGMAS